MANRLGKIYGTEEDKHGDKCNRIHNKPTISQTILFKHLYDNPHTAIVIAEGNKVSDEALQEALKHFENFYESIFIELANFGELLELNVCDNLGDHLIGNVYAKFNSEEEAEKAYKGLNGKFYNDKQVIAEYSPVTNFKESRCRQYEEGSCGRGGFCNFMHLKYVSKHFKSSLFEQMYAEHPEYRKIKRERSRSHTKKKVHHRHSSSESSLGSRDSDDRKRIIAKWNRRYERKKEDERKKRDTAEARINLALIEQKLAESAKHAESRMNEMNVLDNEDEFNNNNEHNNY